VAHADLTPEEYVQAVEDYRRHKDDVFASAPDSPLPDDVLASGFTGLRYYPPAIAYRLEAQLTELDDLQVVTLGSTGGDIRRQLRFATLDFEVLGVRCRLIAFKDAGDPGSGELFIPFKDATSGGETYGGGRYLEPEDEPNQPSPRTVILDFNLAYSPYCAYNTDYSCTLPPPENVLSVPIVAGELLYPVDAPH
jgi:uncharacterized protein (DUF1684 family)